MNHVIRPLRVFDQSVEDNGKGADHDWKHDWVCSVEGIFLDQVAERQEWDCESSEEHPYRIPL